MTHKKPQHSHTVVETGESIGAYGWDRKSNEETIIYYLQKFSDDAVMQHLVPKCTDAELDDIYHLITTLLKNHLTENQYHSLFLKDGH